MSTIPALVQQSADLAASIRQATNAVGTLHHGPEAALAALKDACEQQSARLGAAAREAERLLAELSGVAATAQRHLDAARHAMQPLAAWKPEAPARVGQAPAAAAPRQPAPSAPTVPAVPGEDDADEDFTVNLSAPLETPEGTRQALDAVASMPCVSEQVVQAAANAPAEMPVAGATAALGASGEANQPGSQPRAAKPRSARRKGP